MKKLLIILFVLSGTSLMFAQTNNFEKIKLSGTKSLVTKSYTVENGKRYILETKRFAFDSNGNVTSVRFDSPGFFNEIDYTYDAKGKMTYEKMYNLGKVIRSYKYEYNKSGKKIYASSFNLSEDVDMETVYEYDEKGNLLKEETESGKRKFGFKYTYDKNSRKTDMVVYNPTQIEKKFYCYYDDKGLLIEEKGVFYWAGNKNAKHNNFSRKSFSYNENSQLKEMDCYITDELYEKYLYTYKSNGLLSKWEKYNTEEKLSYVVEYDYE
ncbi:MAG TPA: hypothetical protein VIL99_09465 [Ignavibacteria bacterium]